MQEAFAKWWRGDRIRFSVAVLATVYFLYYVHTMHDWHFVDYVNLIIHEAGHWLFLPFGQFMNILGGSLFQSIFLLIYVGYFYLRQDYFSGSLLLFWCGQNLINVSIYAADAQTMALPLLGGDAVIHDWNFILSSTHALQYTAQIASCIYGAGLVIILIAAALSLYFSQDAEIVRSGFRQ